MDDKETEKIGGWNLPDDLTKLILLRLPAIDLFFFKFVSKLWLSLISSPDFISDHIDRCESDLSNHLLLCHLYPSWVQQPGSYRSVVNFLSHEVAVVGSANGLLCIVSISNPMLGDDVWILNPLTRHIRKLPVDESKRHYADDTGVGKGYFVFWWDSNGDGDGEYKLAKIVPKMDYYSETTVASLWVSGSPETWSEIHVGFDGAYYHPNQIVSGCDVVIGDFAYWIVLKGQDQSEPQELFVLSLNLKTLSLSLYGRRCPLRDNMHYTRDNLVDIVVSRQNCVMFAGSWNGEFVLVEGVGGPQMYDVWTMDDVEGWSKICSIDYPILKWVNDVNGKLVIMIAVEPSECGLALYDIVSGEAEVIEDFIFGHITASAHDFVGSIASIEGFKPIEAADGLIPQDLRFFWPPTFAARMSGKY